MLREFNGENVVGLNMYFQVVFDLNDRGREP